MKFAKFFLLLFVYLFTSAQSQQNTTNTQVEKSSREISKETYVGFNGNVNTDINFPDKKYGISGVNIEYLKVYEKNLLLGFLFRINSGSLGYYEGGSLDNGSYFQDSWGLKGPSVGIIGTYLFSSSRTIGNLSPYLKGTIEYLEGKKYYKTVRFSRSKKLFTLDDKEAQSSESNEQIHKALISNLSIGVQIHSFSQNKNDRQTGLNLAINSLFDFTQSNDPIVPSGREKNFQSYLGSQLELGLFLQF